MHLARFSKTLAWLTLLGFTFPTTVAIGETHTTPHPPGIRTVGALPKHPPTVLQGQVSQTTIQTVQPYTGQVVDSSGKAIPQASIRLPALGWMSTTDAEGRFSLPPFPGSQAHSPWMLQISHPRFKPKTELVWPATPHNSPPHQAFRFTLQVGQHSLLLDQQLRHLGDGLWSKRSAHAGRLQAARNTSHAIYRVRFLMPKPQTTAPPRQAWITLGAVWGLDTAEAHADGHSQANAHSSPMTVWLNGVRIGAIHHNGSHIQIPVPLKLLHANGDNLLELLAGHRLNAPEDASPAEVDDVDWMGLSLEWTPQ